MSIENACINCKFVVPDYEVKWKKRFNYAKCGHPEARYRHRTNLVTGIESYSSKDCDDMRAGSGACSQEGLLFMEKESLFQRLFRA